VIKVAVLVSGGGTNLQAILDAIDRRALAAEVALVLSNKPGVLALDRAGRHNVPTQVIDHRAFPTRDAFDQAIVDTLRACGTEWVVLAGFMRIITPVLLDAFPSRVVNVHPALLPAFPGAHAQAQALAYGVRFTGCTVHLVDAGTDTGPIIAQAVVPVRDDDTVESLTARILIEEHALLPAVLQWIAEGRVVVRPGAGGARAEVRVLPVCYPGA
jgi:phosphoribosylglycinamide formyltransferase-1